MQLFSALADIASSAAGVVTATISAGGLAVVGVRKTVRGARRLSAALTDVEAIRKEVIPNGGGSLRDAVNRIEGRQAVDRAMLRGLAAAMTEPMFECDLAGRTLWVNERWTQLTGVSAHDALGDGWINAVHQEDRMEVLAEWRAAREGLRVFLYTYRYHNLASGHVVNVTVRVEPILNGQAHVVGWLGSVRINHFED